MFKIGDNVTIKQLTEHDRASDFFNNDTMPKYEQQTGIVTYVENAIKHHGLIDKANTKYVSTTVKVGGG